MSLNIKNPVVHAQVRRLAQVLDVTQTRAVEIAVDEKLAQVGGAGAARAARVRAAVAAAQAAYAGVDLSAIADSLYDEEGLPQ